MLASIKIVLIQSALATLFLWFKSTLALLKLHSKFVVPPRLAIVSIPRANQEVGICNGYLPGFDANATHPPSKVS